MSQLNEALRLIRVFHDKKIKDLAEAIEVSPGYISDIEKCNKKPSIEIIDKYAKFFNTTSSALLFFSEELDAQKGPFKTAIRNKMLALLKAIEDKTLGENK
jgi:transcriptional regulator with XRE-family HTH domain